MKHGTRYAYRNGCHCPKCQAWNTANVAAGKARRLARGLPEDDPRHGTPGGYQNWGCRCPPCSQANSEACAEYYRTHPR